MAARFGSRRLVKSAPGSPVRNQDKILEVLPLRDQVADIVRRMILRGELKPNQQISERQISQKLGISTTPTKEAFRILQVEGLIQSRSRVGSFVSSIPKDHMIQIVSMRGALEGVASYFAALNHTESEVEEMDECMAEVKTMIKNREEPLGIAAVNARFHTALRGSSHNEYLVNLITTMRSIDRTFREMSLEIDKNETKRAYKEHCAILESVKSRDPDLAERLTNQHIRRVAYSVINLQEKNKHPLTQDGDAAL